MTVTEGNVRAIKLAEAHQAQMDLNKKSTPMKKTIETYEEDYRNL